MYKRIKTSLFNHRFIGQFIADRMWVVILYFLIFCTLLTLPTFLSLSNATLYDRNEAIEIQNVLIKANNEAYITDGKLQIDESFYIETEACIYVFGEEAFNSEKLVFSYLEDSVKFSYFGITINSISYDILDNNVKISNSSTLQDSYYLTLLSTTVSDGYLSSAKTLISTISFIVNIITYIFIAIMLYIAGIFINPRIKGIFKTKVVVYSMTSIFIFDLITIVSGAMLFHYIGIIYSCIALFRSLRAIVSIEVGRRKK